MFGWYIDFLTTDGQIESVFIPGSDDEYSDIDNGLASCRSCLFIFELYHSHRFKSLLKIERGVLSNG